MCANKSLIVHPSGSLRSLCCPTRSQSRSCMTGQPDLLSDYHGCFRA